MGLRPNRSRTKEEIQTSLPPGGCFVENVQALIICLLCNNTSLNLAHSAENRWRLGNFICASSTKNWGRALLRYIKQSLWDFVRNVQSRLTRVRRPSSR